MILCVAGNPSIDKLFEVERVTPGRIHRPLAFLQVAGGKGLNVARAAAALGAEVVATGLLAGHAGRWVDEALASEGVRGRFVWCAGETRDSLSVADRETASLTEFYEAGMPVGPDDWRALQAEVEAVLPGASWITMSGSLLPGAPHGGYVDLIRAAGAAGVRSAVDAHGPQLEAAIGASPELVKINRDEAGALLGATVVGHEAAAEAALELRRKAGGGGHAAAAGSPPAMRVASAAFGRNTSERARRPRSPPSHASAGSQFGSTDVVRPAARAASNNDERSGRRACCRK